MNLSVKIVTSVIASRTRIGFIVWLPSVFWVIIMVPIKLCEGGTMHSHLNWSIEKRKEKKNMKIVSDVNATRKRATFHFRVINQIVESAKHK